MFRRVMTLFGSGLGAAFALILGVPANAATNTPPPSQIFLRGGPVDFVGLANVIIIHRQFDTAEILFDVGSATDADGDPLEFRWWDSRIPGAASKAGVRYTNDFAAGQYRVFAEITDQIDTVLASVDFEVISALQAIRLLVGDVELTGRHEQIKQLRASLRLAEKGMERQNWGIATRWLERFKNELTRHLNSDIEEEAAMIERWYAAADFIQWAIKKLPRRAIPTGPPGVFPGGSSGGVVIVWQLPYPANTNIVPPSIWDQTNALALIEARRQQLLSNNVPIVLTNILPPTRIDLPAITNPPSTVITLPSSGDSGAVVIRAWTDANYLNGDGRIFPEVMRPGSIMVTNFLAPQ